MCRLQWQHQNHHSQCNLNNLNFGDYEFYDHLLNHQRLKYHCDRVRLRLSQYYYQ